MMNTYSYKLLFGYSLLFVSLFACSHRSSKTSLISEKGVNENQVPSAVRQSFDKHYPGVIPQFYLEKKVEGDLYEADFTLQKLTTSVTFFPNGDIYKIEKEIEFEKLPLKTQKSITKILDEKYRCDERIATEVLEKRHQNRLTSEIQIKIKSVESRTGYYIVYFNMNGEHLSAEEMVLDPIITLH